METKPEIQNVKEKMKAVWSAGDYGVIARLIMPEASKFINRLNIPEGAKLLDVACGSGNLSLHAAKSGAVVTGIDIVPELIRQAQENASCEGLEIKFVTGDAEEMPFMDNQFDYVVSMFGAMFAPRPVTTARELVRVCKPGGIIAMANWTPEGFAGDFFRLTASFVPPPAGIESPVLWGNENTVRERFKGLVSNLELNRITFDLGSDMSTREVAEHYIKYFGPTYTVYNALDEEKKKEFKTEFVKLWDAHNKGVTGETKVDAEYLEVVAKKV